MAAGNPARRVIGNGGNKKVIRYRLTVRIKPKVSRAANGDICAAGPAAFKRRAKAGSIGYAVRAQPKCVAKHIAMCHNASSVRNKNGRALTHHPSASIILKNAGVVKRRGVMICSGENQKPPLRQGRGGLGAARCRYQKSAFPVVRGKGSTTRMLDTPVKYIIRRSKPRPKPACGAEPNLRSSRYHQ